MKGTTLVELIVALCVFLALMGLLYPVFSFLQACMASIDDTEVLSERGNRLLDYMSEKIRATGFIIGSNPHITFCGSPAVNSLSHTEGDPYDSITFLNTFPIETNTPSAPYLRINAPAAAKETSVSVNTTNLASSFISPNGTRNAKALVTFDVLKPSYPYGVSRWNGTVYTVSAMTGGRLVFLDLPSTPDEREDQLAQDISAAGYVYAVRMNRFAVNASRDLQEVGWNSSCSNSGEVLTLDDTAGPDNTRGGVDALQFEYNLSGDAGVFVSALSGDDLPNVRAVRISLLLRAGFPSRNYTNRESYQAGNLPARVFNDPYKRILLSRTIDVRNLGLWRP